MMIDLLICASGAIMLAWCVWGFRGRSPRARWWLGDRVDERTVLCVIPALGTWLFFGGLLSTTGVNPVLAWIAGVPCVVTFFWGFYGMLLILPIPRFVYPKWARR